MVLDASTHHPSSNITTTENVRHNANDFAKYSSGDKAISLSITLYIQCREELITTGDNTKDTNQEKYPGHSISKIYVPAKKTRFETV